MTENQCITFASYKIAMQIAKCQKPYVEGQFLKQDLLKYVNHYFLHIQIKLHCKMN